MNHALNGSEDGSRLVEPEADFAGLYAAHVGCPGGALPGSYLTDQHYDGRDTRWTIELAVGHQTSSDAVLATTLIASALGRPVTGVAIDHHPSGDVSRALLLVDGPEREADLPRWPGGGEDRFAFRTGNAFAPGKFLSADVSFIVSPQVDPAGVMELVWQLCAAGATTDPGAEGADVSYVEMKDRTCGCGFSVCGVPAGSVVLDGDVDVPAGFVLLICGLGPDRAAWVTALSTALAHAMTASGWAFQWWAQRDIWHVRQAVASGRGRRWLRRLLLLLLLPVRCGVAVRARS